MQNLQYATKALKLGQKLTAVNAYSKREEIFQIKHLNFHPKILEKMIKLKLNLAEGKK